MKKNFFKHKKELRFFLFTAYIVLLLGFVTTIDVTAQLKKTMKTQFITGDADDAELHFYKGGFIKALKGGEAHILIGNRKGLKLTNTNQLYRTRLNIVSINIREIGMPPNVEMKGLGQNVAPETGTDLNITTHPYLHIPSANFVGGQPRTFEHALFSIGDYEDGMFFNIVAINNGIIQFHGRKGTQHNNQLASHAGSFSIQDTGEPLIVSGVQPEVIDSAAAHKSAFVVKKVLRNGQEQGFVGIGVMPGAALHVKGDLKFKDAAIAMNVGVTGVNTTLKNSVAFTVNSNFTNMLSIPNIRILGVTHNFNATVITQFTKFSGITSSFLRLVLRQTGTIDNTGNIVPGGSFIENGDESEIRTESCCNRHYPIGASLSIPKLDPGEYQLFVQWKTKGGGFLMKQAGDQFAVTYSALPIAKVASIPAAAPRIDPANIKFSIPELGIIETKSGLTLEQLTLDSNSGGTGISAEGNSVSFFAKGDYAKLQVDRIYADIFRNIKINVFYGQGDRYEDCKRKFSPAAFGSTLNDCQDWPMFGIRTKDTTGVLGDHNLFLVHLYSPTVNILLTSDRNDVGVKTNTYTDNGANANTGGLIAEFTGNPLKISKGSVLIKGDGIQINSPTDITNRQDTHPVVKVKGDLVFGNDWVGQSAIFVTKNSLSQGNPQNRYNFSHTFALTATDIPVFGTYQLSVYATVNTFCPSCPNSNEHERVQLEVWYNNVLMGTSGRSHFQFEGNNNEGITLSLLAIANVTFSQNGGRNLQVRISALNSLNRSQVTSLLSGAAGESKSNTSIRFSHPNSNAHASEITEVGVTGKPIKAANIMIFGKMN
ncbi:hypothetical protein OAJ27_00195 [bacterium]|nr:hypothetical protein [bacterium]